MKKFHGMKVPKQIKYWNKDGDDMIVEAIELGKVFEIGYYFVKDRKSKRFNRNTRPFKIQPSSYVRGYRVDKPEFKDSFFFPKYSQAIKVLLMGIRGNGKIEAVR